MIYKFSFERRGGIWGGKDFWGGGVKGEVRKDIVCRGRLYIKGWK